MDALTDEAIASPLTLLLEEERHGDRQAEDVLLLTFTSNLGFLEAFGLGVAQACGARVTVVSDVRMSAPDPRAARRAGRSYLPAHALCQGAFHPKLVLITGRTRIVAAIGSANATLDGWQANAELWAVLRGDTTSCPDALVDLATWLRGLPNLVRLSPGAPEALNRVASHIDAVNTDASSTTTNSLRLVSTSPGPIIDQLPSGPVDELCLCAPFHDPGAVAVRALVDHLQPGLLRVSYQPQLTELNGVALTALADEINTEVRVDNEHRYRHGKLIEWAVSGKRWALTGSPNLSAAALLQGIADGGNCELGVVAPVATSLLPEGSAVPVSTVAHERFAVRSRPVGGPLLLGATRVENGLHVVFARPLQVSGYLELSHAASPPEVWERAGDVGAGDGEAIRTVAADGGSRVRFVSGSEDGTPTYSNIVFVVDPDRILQRPGTTVARTPTTRADDLFIDPRLADKVFDDLVALSDELPSSAPRVPAATETKEAAASAATDDLDGWERYLDECAGRVGHPLLRFALGLPALPPGAEAAYEPLLNVSWAEEMVIDAEAGLDNENVDDVAAEQETGNGALPTVLTSLFGADFSVRRRYRRWAERLTNVAPRLGAPGRMLVTRLLLWTAAAGAWDREDHQWVQLLSRSVQTLGEADLPPQAEPQVGSLAAVALSVLRAEAPRYTYTEDTMAFEAAAAAIAHLLAACDTEYVHEYTHLLDSAFGPAVEPETIAAVAAEVVQNDPVEDAYWALVERERDVHRHGQRLLHVTGSFGNPLLVALEAVGVAQEAELVGAWAASSNGKWALCIWQYPDLFTVEQGGGPNMRWRHFRLRGLVTPFALAREKSLDAATSVHHGPYANTFAEVTAALDRLGLCAPIPPTDCAS